MKNRIFAALSALVPAFAFIAAAPAAAQETGSIAGVARSVDDNSLVPFVQFRVAGTDRVALSDAEGRFVIASVPAGARTLVVEGVHRAEPVSVEVPSGGAVEVEVAVSNALFSMPPIEVQATRSYRQEFGTVGTRIPARLMDVPQSVQVLSRKFIEDQGATQFEDLYRSVSGLVDHPYSEMNLRGFQQREILFNGVRGNPYGSLDGGEETGFSTSVGRLTNVERVEVVKGPASVLYGSAEPGGVINYVTKKPQESAEFRASLLGGSYAQRGGSVEATGPFTGSRRLLYRGAAFFEEKDSFRNNAGFRDLHLAAGLAWVPSTRTRVDLELERIDQDLTGHRLRGIPVDPDGTFLTSRVWTTTEPTDFTRMDATVFQASVSHAAEEGLSVDGTFRVLGYDRAENYHEPRGILEDGRSMQREFRDQFRSNDDWSATANLHGRVEVPGAGTHALLGGVEITQQDWLFRYARARQSGRGGPVPDLDLFSPVYNGGAASSYGLGPDDYSEQEVLSRRYGVFVQDQMYFGSRWVLAAGGRYDRYDDEGTVVGESGRADASALTGRLGLVFKPSERLSLYTNAANGFSRADFVHQVPSANGPFDPSRSRQVEAGAKADLLGRRLMLMASVFQIHKTNVLRPDPAYGPTGNNYAAAFATGEVRSRGLEVDLAGTVGDRMSVAANYAWLDSEILRDDDAPDNVGRPWPNSARHSAGLSSRYAVRGDVGLALGLTYVGEREQPFAGIRAPAFTVVDLAADVRLIGRFDLRVAVNNVFDTSYATASLFAARAGNIPGDPRTLAVTLTTSSLFVGR